MSYAYASQFMEGVSQVMQLNRTDVLLDVGCGVGSLTALLSKRVARVTAFDISPEMIKEAKEISKAKNITYSLGDATKLSTYEEYRNSFDKVVAHFALHWMKDYKTALEGIYQSLKPDGQCFMNMSQQKSNLLDTMIVLNSYTSPKWETFMKGYEHHYYPFKGSVDEFKQMLACIGFKDIDCIEEIVKVLFKNDEAKAVFPTFMGQLERFPEDKKEEYIKDALTFAFHTFNGEYCMTVPLIRAVARK
ncbi:juvenile hormone acid O-methyltransferase-like isoform X2 [Ptychodera flava]|uniref:juvenile hormone acid O-methyltransferase-like isoform X2 n=1 Tax=Ptychodera flava TaxID=63121 RepID=UPI003969D5CC